MKLKFTKTFDVPEEYWPKPALSSVPDWYKSTESYVNGSKKPNGNGGTSGTIKRCMPVFDAITSGYILYTYSDVYVSQKPIEYLDAEHKQITGEDKNLTIEKIEKRGIKKTEPYYEWSLLKTIEFHPVIQAPLHPGRGELGDGMSYPKWVNPWAIETPKGYSVLVTQPMHRESPFTILQGIVDTDTYNAPINFPFVLNNWEFEGLIPAGTPMAQIIPFKRDFWKMEFGNEKDLKDQARTALRLKTVFFDSYKNKFRQPKEYK